MRERYAEQVRLLLDVLPAVAAEPDFALKGGTAINFFHRDLPRLSVDIDLTFLPIEERARSLADIDAALGRIAASGAGRGVHAARVPQAGAGATRVLFRRGAATVKVETSPVLRGSVFEPVRRRTSATVEDEYGFAEANVVAFEDLYAGKLHAALDRQHPRDLFDVKLLLEHEGVTDDLFRAFLVHVASSNRPPHELLDPNLLPLQHPFDHQFAGMTVVPVSVDELAAARDELIGEIRRRLSGPAAEFLRSLARAEPDFDAIGLPDAQRLPAVRWKVRNLRTLMATDPAKHDDQVRALDALLR